MPTIKIILVDFCFNILTLGVESRINGSFITTLLHIIHKLTHMGSLCLCLKQHFNLTRIKPYQKVFHPTSPVKLYIIHKLTHMGSLCLCLRQHFNLTRIKPYHMVFQPTSPVKHINLTPPTSYILIRHFK